MSKNSSSPKDGAERSQDYRDRQKALGRKPRLYYLTDAEKVAIDAQLRHLRTQQPKDSQ